MSDLASVGISQSELDKLFGGSASLLSKAQKIVDANASNKKGPRNSLDVLSEYVKSGYMMSLAQILIYLDKNVADELLKDFTDSQKSRIKIMMLKLKCNDPDVIGEVKHALITQMRFEDIIILEDSEIQKLLFKLDKSELAIALSSSDDELKEKFTSNMVPKELQTFETEQKKLKNVHPKDIKIAQQNIISLIHRLANDGGINVKF